MESIRRLSCPHCSIFCLHDIENLKVGFPEYEIPLGPPDETGQIVMGLRRSVVLRCQGCSKHTYRLIQTIRIPELGGDSNPPHKIIHQYPVSTPILDPNIPEPIRKAATEAELCLSVGALNACGVMARRAIHALCDDKNVSGKDLYSRLRSLRDNNLITPTLFEWAEEIRTAGKVGAHSEWEELSPDQTEYVLRLLRDILKFVYIQPAEVEANRLKGSEKRKP